MGMDDAAGSGTVSDDELADQFSDPWGSPRHIHGPPTINNIKTGDNHTDDEDDDPPPGKKYLATITLITCQQRIRRETEQTAMQSWRIAVCSFVIRSDNELSLQLL